MTFFRRHFAKKPVLARKMLAVFRLIRNVVSTLVLSGVSELSSFLVFVKGSRILMTEKDLNGTARVAVDGMATEEECKMLIKLAEVCSSFFSP